MELAQPLRPARSLGRAERERVAGSVLFEFIEPVSPELALVDPELARRASALLPDAPGIRIAGRHETIELLPFSIPALPSRSRITPALASATVLVALGVAGLAWWMAPAVFHSEPVVQFRAPAAAPTVPPTPASSPTQSPTAPTPQSGSPVAQPPRFVWPAEPGALGYRVALYRAGVQIFERDVTGTALEFPATWTYGGKLESLTRGTYHWIVWPLVALDPARAGKPIVSARYTV